MMVKYYLPVILLCSVAAVRVYPSKFDQVAALLQPAVQQVAVGNCRQQLETFLHALKNSSLWAVQILDSSAKLPQGLVTAQAYQLGNYDQCVAVDLQRRPEENIRGQYCLAKVEFLPQKEKYPRFYQTTPRDPLSLWYGAYESVWETFLIPGVPERMQRNVFRSGVCVPDACAPQDVKLILNHVYNNLVNKYGVVVNVTVSRADCSTNQPKPLSTEVKMLLAFIAMSVGVVLLVTLWDTMTLNIPNKVSGRLKLLTEAFSLRSTYVKTFSIAEDKDLEVIHSLKTMSMFLILFGHRIFTTFGGPVMNLHRLEEGFQNAFDMYILNGPIVVDTFFVIGGFLTSHCLIQEYRKNPNTSAWMVYFKRWLRIAPTYMLVVFFYAHLLEHLGSGPLWNERMGREAERCQASWWANFLYVNNYVSLDNICMLQSWYIAVDMHCVLLAPIIVKQLVLRPRRGWLLVFVLTVASLLIPFHQIYTNDLPAVLKTDTGLIEDQTTHRFFIEFYIKSHNRFLPYLVGICAAWLYFKLKESRFHPSKMSSVAATLFYIVTLSLTIVCSLGAYLAAWWYLRPGTDNSPFQNALFGASQRLFWALAMSWIIIGCSLNFYGVYVRLFIRNAFVPLSRLSYSIFLIHGVVQMCTTASRRTIDFVSIPKLVWLTCADLAASVFFAFLLQAFFKDPVQGLVDVFIFKKGALTPNAGKTKESGKEAKISQVTVQSRRRKGEAAVRKRLGGH